MSATSRAVCGVAWLQSMSTRRSSNASQLLGRVRPAASSAAVRGGLAPHGGGQHESIAQASSGPRAMTPYSPDVARLHLLRVFCGRRQRRREPARRLPRRRRGPGRPPPGCGRRARAQRNGVRGRRRPRGRSASSRRRRSWTSRVIPRWARPGSSRAEREPWMRCGRPRARCPCATGEESFVARVHAPRVGRPHYAGRSSSRRPRWRRSAAPRRATPNVGAYGPSPTRRPASSGRGCSRRPGHRRGRGHGPRPRSSCARSWAGRWTSGRASGSRILVRPVDDGRIELAGRAVLDEVRDYEPA